MESSKKLFEELKKLIQKLEEENGWGGRIRTHEWRDQNPLPYRLATPQYKEKLRLKARQSSIKNTIRKLLALLVLKISLSSVCFASTINKAPTGITNSSQYHSELLISKNKASPIDLARFYRNGILYSSQGQLYFDEERINLLNSFDDSGLEQLKVNNIVSHGKDFYLATDIGIFKNFRRIFTKGPCHHIALGHKEIFISCATGIYRAQLEKKKILQQNYKWRFIELSPVEVNFFTLNKSKSNLEFISASNGFYYYDSRKKKFLNHSYGLKRDFKDSFGFGRFYVERFKKQPSIIYLTTSAGLFISKDQGISWIKNNSGLKSNPDGFFNLREIKEHGGKLVMATSTGLYQSPKEQRLKWQKLTIDKSLKNSNYNEDYYSIDIQDGQILASNSQGQVFRLNQNHIVSQEQEIKPQINNLIQTVIKSEPKIQELHKVALKFAGIPTGKKFRGYKMQARLRNIVPNFEAFLDRDKEGIISIERDGSDTFNSNTNSINTKFEELNIDRNDRETKSGIRFSWRLSNLIYDPEINDINNSARITANIRENILTEITQIYYQRKELLYRLLSERLIEQISQFDLNFISQKLKFEEYTAQLDARTGSWFSEHLYKRIAELDKQLSPETFQNIKEIYYDS